MSRKLIKKILYFCPEKKSKNVIVRATLRMRENFSHQIKKFFAIDKCFSRFLLLQVVKID